MKIQGYEILSGDSPQELAGLVKNWIMDGWQPQGGVAVCAVAFGEDRKGNQQHEAFYFQAMILLTPTPHGERRTHSRLSRKV